jgi:hypothetical protein
MLLIDIYITVFDSLCNLLAHNTKPKKPAHACAFKPGNEGRPLTKRAHEKIWKRPPKIPANRYFRHSTFEQTAGLSGNPEK